MNKCKKLHISQVSPKTAEILAVANMKSDWYHNNIALTAEYLVEQEHPKARYITQWSSGNCVWEVETGGRVGVDPETGRVF